MAWEIDEGPVEVRDTGFDGVLWQWQVRDQHAGVIKPLYIGVSRTALASKSLPEPTADAILSRGRDAIRLVLGWDEPPDRIDFFTTQQPRIIGGLAPARASATFSR